MGNQFEIQNTGLLSLYSKAPQKKQDKTILIIFKNLSFALRTSTVLVSELLPVNSKPRTLPFYHNGECLDNIEYDIRWTPRETLISNTILVHISENVFNLKPYDSTLKPMNAVS